MNTSVPLCRTAHYPVCAINPKWSHTSHFQMRPEFGTQHDVIDAPDVVPSGGVHNVYPPEGIDYTPFQFAGVIR